MRNPDTVLAATVRSVAIAMAALATQAGAQGIYTCTDAKGRRLTADRPIVECIDREQTELSPGGLPRRRIGPTPTAAERAADEEKARLALEDRNRLADEKKREKALVTRYPTRVVHGKERAEALELVDSVTVAAQKRTKELLTQRKFLDNEVEFYKLDPSRMPAKLRRQIDEVDKQLDAQGRFVADQEVEKVRVNARFDEELARLTVLWARQGLESAAARTVPVSRPASSSATR